MSAMTACTLSLAAGAARAAEPPSGDRHPEYERRVLAAGDGETMPYRILRPLDPEPGRRYPVVFFLHGAGERGDDNASHLAHGASFFSDPQNRAKFPAIVVFPQCPADGYWVDLEIRERLYAHVDQTFEEVFAPPTRDLTTAMRILDHVLATEPADPDRVYIMGLSMGGLGTYEALARWPEKFAAAVAICGGGNLEATERYADRVAIWITHGDEDPIVPVKYSRLLYETLRERGAEVRYTEFPGVGHDAWTPTFALPDLLPWLFSHTRQPAPAAGGDSN